MDLLPKIIDKKLPVIIISPHPDDAILSCGWLLKKLSGKVSCTVINVFTKANKGPHTLSAKQFLKISSNRDALSLYKERMNEDVKAQLSLGTRVIDLGLEDALFRRKKHRTFMGKFIPELDHIYPTYRWHILKRIAAKDPAIVELKKKLKPFAHKRAIVFAPYGIGNHVDHMLALSISKELFANLILYSDFPYNIRLNNYGRTMLGVQVFKLVPDMQKKNKLIKLYKTQFSGLFPGGTVPEHKEIYFVPEKNILLK